MSSLDAKMGALSLNGNSKSNKGSPMVPDPNYEYRLVPEPVNVYGVINWVEKWVPKRSAKWQSDLDAYLANKEK